MTDEELTEVERMSWLPNTANDAHARMLVAEVRRLRGLVMDAGCDGWCVWCSNTMADGYHRDPDVHDAECPAFTPDGAVR